MSEKKPLLSLVRDELVEMDRDNVIELYHQRALRDLVELLREGESVVMVRRPGEPLPDQNALVLRTWLLGSSFSLPRTADLDVVYALAASNPAPLTNEQVYALQRVHAALESPAAVS
jgi:hypothetical protein